MTRLTKVKAALREHVTVDKLVAFGFIGAFIIGVYVIKFSNPSIDQANLLGTYITKGFRNHNGHQTRSSLTTASGAATARRTRTTLTPTPTKGVSKTPTPTISKKPTAMPTTRSASTTPKPSGSITPTPSGAPVSNIPSSSSGVALGFATLNSSASDFSKIESQLGPVEMISVFRQFGLPGNDAFNSGDVIGTGKSILLAWEPWDPDQQMNQSKDYLKEITAGKQDTYMKVFAADVKKYGKTVQIRFGHEMNGDWYPWGNRPADYIAAYRHVVDLFRAQGVTNVTWVWCINADNVPYTPINTVTAFYPGNDYVDLIGIDGFNFGSNGGGFRSFQDLFEAPYSLLASTYPRPVAITETASAETGGNKAQWITEMFSYIKAKMPTTPELIWFNINKEEDWRIDSTPSTLSSFQAGSKQL